MYSKIITFTAVSIWLPVAAAAQDASAWAGAYVGVQAGFGTGGQEYNPASIYDLEGKGVGVHAGYLWSSGALAYGVELAYARTDYAEVDLVTGTTYPEYNFNHTLDLKARLGYGMDRALIYGVLGYGFSEYEDGNTDPGNLYDIEAPIFGLGVDYMVSDRFMIGAEILRRDLDSGDYFQADLTTVTLRAGVSF